MVLLCIVKHGNSLVIRNKESVEMSWRHSTAYLTAMNHDHSSLFPMRSSYSIRLVPVTVEESGLDHLLVTVVYMVCDADHIYALKICLINAGSRPHITVRETGVHMHVTGQGEISLHIRKKMPVLCRKG